MTTTYGKPQSKPREVSLCLEKKKSSKLDSLLPITMQFTSYAWFTLVEELKQAQEHVFLSPFSIMPFKIFMSRKISLRKEMSPEKVLSFNEWISRRKKWARKSSYWSGHIQWKIPFVISKFISLKPHHYDDVEANHTALSGKFAQHLLKLSFI